MLHGVPTVPPSGASAKNSLKGLSFVGDVFLLFKINFRDAVLFSKIDFGCELSWSVDMLVWGFCYVNVFSAKWKIAGVNAPTGENMFRYFRMFLL